MRTGAIPALLQTFIDTLDETTKFAVTMNVSGAVTFKRNHPMTLMLAQGMGWNDEQVDALWRAASDL